MIVQLLYFSNLLPNKYPEDAANLFAALEKHHVAYGFIKGAKDVRIRDFMPIQVRGRWPPDNVFFWYEPSYFKNRRDLQTVFLQNIDTNWQLVNGWRPPCDFDRFDKSEINLDGGNILTLPCSEKVIIGDRVFSENPEYGNAELIRKLETFLHRKEVVIIPSLEKDITGHADNMVRFLDGQTVVCVESDSIGRQLQTILQYHGLDVLEFPSAPAEDRSGVRSYLNYLETDEAVFLPAFGIDTDTKAIAAVEKLFSKPVEPVMIPHLAADGSGLHSISWGMSY